MKTQEFIEHLKKIYEDCSVYFDIQENAVIVKNEIPKEIKVIWDENESRLRQERIEAQEARSLGIEVEESEIPPQCLEDICKDNKYQLGETYFQWLINKLDEWETNQNKKVENISSLIEFLEWTAIEQEKLEKEIEEAREQRVKEFFLARFSSELEQKWKEFEEFLKSIHPDFTPELQEQWKKCGFGYEECKEWINAGLRPEQSVYAAWLRDILELSPQDYLVINDDKLLREKFQETLLESADDEEEKEFITTKLRELSLEVNDNNNNSEEIRNILLIGRTGSGKSTLANVLINRNGNFEEVFKESAGSVSETKNIQTEKFTIDISRDGKEKIHYQVIDTAGFGDTQLDNKEVLKLLSKIIRIIGNDGVNRIFFVTGGRFTQQELETYKLLGSVIFDKKASNYTTIIRTNFSGFEKEDKCEEDRKKLEKENEEIFKILDNNKIIYVDNLPIADHYSDMARTIRERSRKRLLTHLGTCQNNYYPSDLENLNQRIDNYMNKEEELQRELAEKEQIIRDQEAELQKEVEVIQTQKNRELRIVERNFERQIQELQKENSKKNQIMQQELEGTHQLELQLLRDAYDKKLGKVRQQVQNNLTEIRNSYNYVEVGKPVCRYGHDRDIQVYDKSGYLIPEYQSDFIGHIYCPTCGSNDYDPALRNAQTYTLEEWSRKNAQQAAEKRRKMQEVIDEQNRKEQEIINKINQERINLEIQKNRDIQEKKRLEEQVVSKYAKIREERLNQERLFSEGKINSSSQDRENELRKELEASKQALAEHIRQIEERKNAAQQELYAYIEQKTDY